MMVRRRRFKEVTYSSFNVTCKNNIIACVGIEASYLECGAFYFSKHGIYLHVIAS